jgi:hypothetical protein
VAKTTEAATQEIDTAYSTSAAKRKRIEGWWRKKLMLHNFYFCIILQTRHLELVLGLELVPNYLNLFVWIYVAFKFNMMFVFGS